METADYKNETGKFIVAARIGSDYGDCIVAPEDALIVETHRKVFGPASEEECEQWRKQNCV